MLNQSKKKKNLDGNMNLHKELEEIFIDCNKSGGRRMLFNLSDHNYMEVKELFTILREERDESYRIRKEYFKRIQDLSEELQTIKDKIKEYAGMMNSPETTHDDIEDNLNELIKLLK